MQRVVGNRIEPDAVPDVAQCPVGQRIDLGALWLLLDLGYFRPGAGLLAAQTGQPAFFAGQGALERLHLADVAALFAQVQAFVHGIKAIGLHKSGGGLKIGAVNIHLDRVALLDASDQGHGFCMQHAGIEHKDAGINAGFVQQVGHDHVFGAQAGGLRQRRVGGG